MKFSDYLKLTEATQNLETALKSVREYIRKPNSGVGPEGKKTCEKIIDTLLASADDEKTFERYYNKFMADHPDAMDFVLDEIYAQMGVDDAEAFFAKAFNKAAVKEGVEDQKFTDFDKWKAAVKQAYPKFAAKMLFKGRVERGQDTISAEVPGLDRSFGVWTGDEEDGQGVILGESLK